MMDDLAAATRALSDVDLDELYVATAEMFEHLRDVGRRGAANWAHALCVAFAEEGERRAAAEEEVRRALDGDERGGIVPDIAAEVERGRDELRGGPPAA